MDPNRNFHIAKIHRNRTKTGDVKKDTKTEDMTIQKEEGKG